MSPAHIGAPAPAFSLLNQDGNPVSLDAYQNQWRVVYFYPKASTPGCTVQACGLRDTLGELRSLRAEVFGISPDAPTKLKKFAQAQNLPFTLLSDPDHTVAEAYGVWALKKFMGKTFMGVVRTTFIIDPNGNLASILNDFKTSTHHEVLLSALKQVQAA